MGVHAASAYGVRLLETCTFGDKLDAAPAMASQIGDRSATRKARRALPRGPWHCARSRIFDKVLRSTSGLSPDLHLLQGLGDGYALWQ